MDQDVDTLPSLRSALDHGSILRDNRRCEEPFFGKQRPQTLSAAEPSEEPLGFRKQQTGQSNTFHEPEIGSIENHAAKGHSLKDHIQSIIPTSKYSPFPPNSRPQAKSDKVQKWPTDVPYAEPVSQSPYPAMPKRLESPPTSPWLGQSRLESPGTEVSTNTVTPTNAPLSPRFKGTSESTATTSSVSSGSLNGIYLDFQEEKVEVSTAKRVTFLQHAKKADFVALSPNSEYAAFIFSKQIQVCRVSYEWGSLRPLEIKMMLTLGKKDGRFVAAALSTTHLVAISDQEV